MPAIQASPQAILPRALDRTRPIGVSAGFTKPYTNGKNRDTFFIDLPAQQARQIVVNNQSGVTIEAKLSLHTANDNDNTTSVPIPDQGFYVFDVMDASDISIRRADADGTKAAVQVTVESKI